MISLQVGDCWVWSLIIFLVFRCLVSAMFGPHAPKGGCAGACPPTKAARGSRGGSSYCLSPPGGGSVAVPPKRIFYEKCLVKYCNFVVNLDHSLCHRSDGRSYVNLRVFCPRRQPSIIFGGIVVGTTLHRCNTILSYIIESFLLRKKKTKMNITSIIISMT